MLDRLRRRPAALLLTALLPASLALAACGDGDEQLKGFDAVSISGAVGSTPKLDWKGKLAAGKRQVKVVTEGDGPEIAKGDVVQVDFTMANGYTHKVTYDAYDKYSLSTLVKVGTELVPSSFSDLLAAGIDDEIKAGQKIGTRIAVTMSSEDLIADYLGNAQAAQLIASKDIGNEDGLLFVADLTAVAGPSGTEEKAPAWAPKIVEEDGVPSSFDFKGAPAPSGKLEVAAIILGDGPKVKSGQNILASYLGQLPKEKTPFDESYADGRALAAVVGGADASVVKGWSKGLVGLPVGSRVLLQIPPSLGYGKEAQKDQAGKVTIPANSTLYFIVDILDVADPEPAPEPAEPASPTDAATGTPSGTPSTEPSEGASE
ncbi:MAG: FKBP-type peptidyl-prolyl cis-trans isomerase [Propionibacteriales bacterium]|nr:FKBP-type peptidyl-prolyl cis-trans isomerase [Propionibacteriales bacterium]